MSLFTPVLPLVGAETRFQPVWVEDVAEAAARACTGVATGAAEPGLAGVYELGGPRVATFRELMQLMLAVIRRRRAIVDIPLALARLMARFMQLTAWLGIKPMLTVDQVRLLERDNVVAPGAQGFSELGIAPTAMEAILDGYLYAYRRHGQYSVLNEPAELIAGQAERVDA